jgi:signal transduction histidine kinase
MSDRRRATAIACMAGVVGVIGVAAEWLAHGTRLGFAEQRDLLTGWMIAGSGLLAWGLVPTSRTGPLLTATGLAWFLGTPSDAFTDGGRLAQALTFLYAGLLTHAIVTFPTGRATRAVDRILVVGGYVVALFPPLWQRNLNLDGLGLALAIGLVVQHATMPDAARRTRRPALGLGLALAAVLAGKGLLGTWLREAGVAFPGDPEAIWQIALVTVAIGLAWSLLRIEQRRATVADLVVRLGSRSTALTDLSVELQFADEAGVSDALMRAHAMAERNATLHAQLQTQVDEIAASRRRLLEAGDQERQMLEEHLRHGAADRLGRLAIELAELGRDDVVAELPAEAIARVARARNQLERARVELDELARGLDPGVLTDLGLLGALRDLASRSPVPVELSLEPVGVTGSSIDRTLFFVAAEAIANVVRHAHCKRAWLRLDRRDGYVALQIEDDGVGGADPARGTGLTGLRDRLDAFGGVLAITARAGGGTRLLVTVPTGRLGRTPDPGGETYPAPGRAG